jgi:TolB-like protein/Tfp pilus assembly protein PilF
VITGRRISHFRVLEQIGAGGMGEVYRARDEQLGRDVAIKVLAGESLNDVAAHARLLREARTASKLNHPHICTIHEVGESDGQAYIAMELVEGEPLSARLNRGTVPPAEVLRYGIQIADALAHAHKHGVIHRDLKCANVVITPEGRAKVLDFGLAKRLAGKGCGDGATRTMDSVTEAGKLVGTLAYMAPEQLRGQPADTRSDVWSLGVMLYEMTSGRRPFQGQTGFELSSAILNQPPPPLEPGPGHTLPAGLGTVIAHCLEKEPGQRYQRSEEIRAALEALQSGTTLPARRARKPQMSHRWWWALAGAMVALVAVVLGVGLSGLRERLLGGVAAPRFSSLAVLPVANLSGDPEQEYFADGMTDALINDISQIGALKVISRTSAMLYKGTKKSLPQIARDLKVEAVLETSVIREGTRVRVTAQLIEASTDRHVWAQSYDREMSSVLALQSEVARAVARSVNGKLKPQEEVRLARGRAINPATYEDYLRGMYYMNKATPESIQKGMKYLQQAIERDPADPLGYAGLAMGYIEIAHGADPTDDALQRAKAAARTALKLDDTLAEVLVASGFVEGYHDWQWDDALRDIRRALDINPSLAIGHYHTAWILALFGHTEEAIREHRRAQELDPLNPMHTAWLGELYRWERRYDLASAEALRSLQIDPKFAEGHYILANVYLDEKKYDQAIAEVRKAANADPDWRWALGPAYAAAGRPEEARKVLAELSRQKVIPWIAFWRVMNYAALGENDEAFRWIDYRGQHAWIPWIRVISDLPCRNLRKDPRFPDQMRRMNLPPVGPAPTEHGGQLSSKFRSRNLHFEPFVRPRSGIGEAQRTQSHFSPVTSEITG